MEHDGTDLKLVRRAVAGDTVALKLLLTESHRGLCDQLSRRVPTGLRSVVDVEDVAQEAHIEVFRRIGAFVPHGPSSFYRWVAAIGLSRLRNALRWHRARKRGGEFRPLVPRDGDFDDSTISLLDQLAGPGQTPSRCVARGEAITAVQAAIGELPEHYRQAVWLVHIAGQPVREAADCMGRSDRAIHGLCRRGLKLLRERLDSATKFLSRTG